MKTGIKYKINIKVSCVCNWLHDVSDCCCVSEQIVGKYLKELLESTTETTRCGAALALGALPRSFLTGQLDNIIAKLVMASRMTSKQAPFVLCRRDCLKALTRYS